MRSKKNELTLEHCKEVKDCELMIGADNAHDGKLKKFVFHVLDSTYLIYHDWKCVDSGQDVEELLRKYNDL